MHKDGIRGVGEQIKAEYIRSLERTMMACMSRICSVRGMSWPELIEELAVKRNVSTHPRPEVHGKSSPHADP